MEEHPTGRAFLIRPAATRVSSCGDDTFPLVLARLRDTKAGAAQADVQDAFDHAVRRGAARRGGGVLPAMPSPAPPHHLAQAVRSLGVGYRHRLEEWPEWPELRARPRAELRIGADVAAKVRFHVL